MNYIVTTTLPSSFGGRTKSLLRRVALLVEARQAAFTIFTTNYNPEYQATYQRYYSNGWVPRSVRLENVYERLRLVPANRLPDHLPHEVRQEGYEEVRVRNRNAYRYYKDGEYSHFKSFESPGHVLLFVDHLRPGETLRYMRKEYDSSGYCHRERLYFQRVPVVKQETYFKRDGKVYLRFFFKKHPIRRILERIDYYADDASITSFASEQDFLRFAFDQLLPDGSSIICDARMLDKPLLEMRGERLKRIFVLHSSHYDNGRIRGSYRYLLQHSGAASAVVTLTETQRSDWLKEGGAPNAISIPHSVPNSGFLATIARRIADTRRDRKRLVCMTRLDRQKQLDHGILAFAKVLGKHPDAQLDIYGQGEEEANLAQLIARLGIGANCRLMGYSKRPDLVFRAAHCSLMTSRFEGFCLSVLESLANGCAVISYDVKYGPREMIVDGQSGFLVAPDDIGQLAAAMDKALSGFRPRIELDPRYYDDVFVARWSALLRNQTENKE